MKISLRIAEFDDSESIAELSTQLGYGKYAPGTKGRLKTILNNTDHCVFVAISEGQIIGWIHGFYSFRIESDFFIEIGGLVVDKNFRNKRVGARLVDKVTEWAKTKSCKKIRVRCNVIREESHLFYEKIGFETNKEQKIFDKYLK